MKFKRNVSGNDQGVAGCVGVVVLLVIACGAQYPLNQEVHIGVFRCVKTYTVTTGDKDSISTSKRVDLKPATGGPVETMRCDDALMLLQFDSGTVYGQLEPGKWYRITTRGPRSPAFSMFPNLTEAVEVEHKE